MRRATALQHRARLDDRVGLGRRRRGARRRRRGSRRAGPARPAPRRRGAAAPAAGQRALDVDAHDAAVGAAALAGQGAQVEAGVGGDAARDRARLESPRRPLRARAPRAGAGAPAAGAAGAAAALGLGCGRGLRLPRSVGRGGVAVAAKRPRSPRRPRPRRRRPRWAHRARRPRRPARGCAAARRRRRRSSSIVALSVSISASTSPSCTASPSCTSQRAIVPRSIVSDSRGMTISSATYASCQQSALGEQAARGLLDLVLERQRGELQRLGVRHRHLGPAHALDRRVEVVEALARDARRELGARRRRSPSPPRPRARASVFLTLVDDRLGVERPQRAEVDDLDLDAVLGEPVGHRQRAAHGVAVGDDREVAALAHDLRAADRHREVVARLGQRAVDVVEHEVLDEQHRIVVADRRS